MGHEFTGIVKEIGNQVRSVAVGDKIISPFTVSWQVFQPLLVLLYCGRLTCIIASNAFIVRMDIHPDALRAFSSALRHSTVRKQSLSEFP
jgi:Alcohol dehydrogenase GroES-like domain